VIPSSLIETQTPPPALLDFRNVSVARGLQTVLHSITLRVDPGEHVAILGPNGCGKSTLIKTVTRECYPLDTPGSSLTILGRQRWNVFDLRNLLGIVSNDLMSSCTRDITAMDVILSGFFSSIGLQPYHLVTPAMRAQSFEVLQTLEVPHLAERSMTEMSSGEARRVLIGRALVHHPRALLFDEPSNSLDLHAAQELRVLLRKLAARGAAILLVTHHLSDVIPEIDRVILMRHGRIFADGLKSELFTRDLLTELFGIRVDMAHRDGYYHLW